MFGPCIFEFSVFSKLLFAFIFTHIIKSVLDIPAFEESLLCLKENAYETHSHTHIHTQDEITGKYSVGSVLYTQRTTTA
jgi:hypothetical protein